MSGDYETCGWLPEDRDSGDNGDPEFGGPCGMSYGSGKYPEMSEIARAFMDEVETYIKRMDAEKLRDEGLSDEPPSAGAPREACELFYTRQRDKALERLRALFDELGLYPEPLKEIEYMTDAQSQNRDRRRAKRLIDCLSAADLWAIGELLIQITYGHPLREMRSKVWSDSSRKKTERKEAKRRTKND